MGRGWSLTWGCWGRLKAECQRPEFRRVSAVAWLPSSPATAGFDGTGCDQETGAPKGRVYESLTRPVARPSRACGFATFLSPLPKRLKSIITLISLSISECGVRNAELE